MCLIFLFELCNLYLFDILMANEGSYVTDSVYYINGD